ncbi:hypothetical protein LTR86_002180 [Recurvomyces mirabilis]|nr:hypothetical protein LTR86_002180 [Recurvomyces mirabilis]
MTPTLLTLPKELRLMIYDELFRPLIQRPKNFDVLHKFKLMVERAPAKVQNLQACLHTAPGLHPVTKSSLDSQWVSFVNLVTCCNVDFIRDQHSIHASYEAGDQPLRPPYLLCEGRANDKHQDPGWTQTWPELGAAIKHGSINDLAADIYTATLGDKSSPERITAHQLCGTRRTIYTTLTARVKDIAFGGKWDPRLDGQAFANATKAN